MDEKGENENLRAIASYAFAVSSATYTSELGQEREKATRETGRGVSTYFGELEENDLVIEGCEAVLAIGAWDAEGANKDPRGGRLGTGERVSE